MTDSVRVFTSVSFEIRLNPPHHNVLVTHSVRTVYQTRSLVIVVTTGTLITHMEDLHYMRSDLLVATWAWKASLGIVHMLHQQAR